MSILGRAAAFGGLIAGSIVLSGCDEQPNRYSLHMTPSGRIWVIDERDGWLFDCNGVPDGVTDVCRTVGVPGRTDVLPMPKPAKPVPEKADSKTCEQVTNSDGTFCRP
jgi:hypothetical protein